jgi:transcription elongation factor/antiterminator RfaH
MTAEWYALHSKPRKEDLLWEQLQAWKIESYHPRIRVQTVNPRARQVKPYFPGYVFVHVDLDQVNWSSLHWMPGANGLVAFGGEPASVPSAMIRTIRHRVDVLNANGGEQLDGLQRGDRVVIQGGAFNGYEAIFDAKLSGSQRVHVFLSLLQAQQKKLDLPAGQIRKLKR